MIHHLSDNGPFSVLGLSWCGILSDDLKISLVQVDGITLSDECLPFSLLSDVSLGTLDQIRIIVLAEKHIFHLTEEGNDESIEECPFVTQESIQEET